MKGIPGPYWTSEDPTTKVTEEFVRLNSMEVDVEKKLEQLRTDNIGGVLLVTTMIEEDGTKSPPFITILAAPSVATYTKPVKENGVLYDDVWEGLVLNRFKPELDTAVAHCPMIGAQEGFSRALTLKTGMFHLLKDAQPLFLPAGELLGGKITYESSDYPRSIFLPEVCNLPIGMRWPGDVGYKDFYHSIQGALGLAGQVFQKMIKAMQPLLVEWFEAVEENEARFSIPSCPFLTFYDENYPALDNGEWPSVIIDTEGFSPLLDMLNSHLWRIWCDRMLTTETKLNRQYLQQFLMIGEKAINVDTYLGAKIPGRFCPNFAHHFKVTNGWPTDTKTTRFLREFQHPPIISHNAMQFDPIEVDLHQPTLALMTFQTRDELMSDNHKAKTPKYTEISVQTPLRPNTADKPVKRREIIPQSRPLNLEIPVTVKKFTPSPNVLRRLTPSMGPAASIPRRLEDELSAVTNPTSASGGSYNPLSATVYTAEGRLTATNIFLNVCRLLAHHSARTLLHVNNIQLPADAYIFVREPCGLFRREILVNLHKTSPTSGFMPSFLSFVEAMLRPAQIHLSGIYDPQFFSGSFLHAFLSVESWMVSDHMLPANVPTSTFHVYRMISCLQKYAGHPLLLLNTGLSLLDAKQVGILAYYLFAMMDLTDGTFSDEKFMGSILGNRLKIWSTLPDSATIHGLWNRAPLQATYYWLSSLQTLLSIEQNWVKRLRYHPEQGFFHARDADNKRYLLLDNQVPSHIPGRTDTLVQALRQYDTQFEMRWFCGSFLDPIWTNPIPPEHSVQSQLPQHQTQETPAQGVEPDKKRAKLGDKITKVPDYISGAPLMEAVLAIPKNTRSVTMMLVRRISAPISFPRLPTNTGTFQTICLNSAFPSPQNCCVLRLCGNKKVNPPVPRLHIDLSKDVWKNKPETYWAPVVEFLQSPMVTPHLRPSAALKKLTPSTKWT
jgi:hypothetical protein